MANQTAGQSSAVDNNIDNYVEATTNNELNGSILNNNIGFVVRKTSIYNEIDLVRICFVVVVVRQGAAIVGLVSSGFGIVHHSNKRNTEAVWAADGTEEAEEAQDCNCVPTRHTILTNA